MGSAKELSSLRALLASETQARQEAEKAMIESNAANYDGRIAAELALTAERTSRQQAERERETWRGWAQLVYLGGGPAVGTDGELRAAVCAAQDADCDQLRAQLTASEQAMARAEQERDTAWGDLGFTKNDLSNAVHRAEAAESSLASLRSALVALIEEWRIEGLDALREAERKCLWITATAIAAKLACSNQLAAAISLGTRPTGDETTG